MTAMRRTHKKSPRARRGCPRVAVPPLPANLSREKGLAHAARRDRTGPANPNWKGGIGLTEKGYLRFRSGPLSDKYAHREYASRQILASLGRHLRADEHVHHNCRNRACWPPTDFHLVIMDAALDVTGYTKW